MHQSEPFCTTQRHSTPVPPCTTLHHSATPHTIQYNFMHHFAPSKLFAQLPTIQHHPTPFCTTNKSTQYHLASLFITKYHSVPPCTSKHHPAPAASFYATTRNNCMQMHQIRHQKCDFTTLAMYDFFCMLFVLYDLIVCGLSMYSWWQPKHIAI